MRKKYRVEYTLVGKYNPFFRHVELEVESISYIVAAIMKIEQCNDTDIIPTLIELL